MKIYYQNQLNLISEPLEMRDAHANLKNISPSDEFKDEYDMILDSFSKRTISDTLKHIRDEGRISDKSFSSKLDQALEPVVKRKSNTLMNILEGFIETLGASSSFRHISNGLLSRNEQGNYDAICGFLDLEREQPDQQYLDAFKEVLRKYILDFDKKLEDELTRQMIELINEKFTGLEQMVESKEYDELIEEITNLEPREITRTTKSAQHYYQRCTELIDSFRETLIQQSKECMTEQVEWLSKSSEDFQNKLRFFQNSLKQQKSFYLVLVGLDEKLEALNIQGHKIFEDNNINPTKVIYDEFVHRVHVYLDDFITRNPIEDANWTQSLLKLCILCGQFSSGEFEQLKKNFHAQYSDMIQSYFKKSYSLIMEDRNILRNFQEEEKGNGDNRPAKAFTQLMLCLFQVKNNIEKILNDQIAASVGDLILIVKNFIQSIAGSIRNEVMSLFKDLLKQFLNGNMTMGSLSTSGFDIDGIQAALNLIESFSSSAAQCQFHEISQELNNLNDHIIQSGVRAFKESQSNFFSVIEPQSSDIKILENTEICQIYQQIISFNQVSQIKNATSKNFTDIQKRIMSVVKTLSTSIKDDMTNVEKGQHSQSIIQKEALFEGILQEVQEFSYFSGIIEQDLQQLEQIKKGMLTPFNTCMKELYGKINLQQVEDPKSWQEVSKVAIIVDDYVRIKAIFATIGFNTNQSHNDNVKKGFDSAVSTAMGTIYASLIKPIVFMSPAHYKDFSNYYKYLEILMKNQEMYIPDEKQQKLALRMIDYIKSIVEKQIYQLKETFEYRFKSYLFSETHESNRHVILNRPHHIQFSNEEIKLDSVSAQVIDAPNLDQRLSEACQEIKSLIEVPYWLIQQFIYDEMRTRDAQSSTMRDTLKLLSFADIADLYFVFRKSLLDTLFEDFNLKQERLKHEIQLENSLYYYKSRIIKYLRPVDRYFDLSSLEVDSQSIQSLESREKYTEFFNNVKYEPCELKNIDIAHKMFQEANNLDARGETEKFKQLYHKKNLKQLSQELQPQGDYIKNEIRSFIDQETAKLLKLLNMRAQSFESPSSEANEICRSIIQLNAHIQYLPGYVDAEQIEKDIKKAISSVQEVLDKTFIEINELSLNYLFDQAFEKLYTIFILNQKIQSCSNDSSQLDCMPTRNSLEELCDKMQGLIRENKTQMNARFRQLLTDYEKVIPIDVEQLEIIQQNSGYTPAIIIDSIEKLAEEQLKWSDTMTQISLFVSSVINKFKISIGSLKSDATTEQSQLVVKMQKITNLRGILKFLPESYMTDIKKAIEAQTKILQNQSQIILQQKIDQLFEAKDFDAIAQQITENSDLFNEKFKGDLKFKFTKLIKPVCKEGEKIVCAVRVQPQLVLQFMNEHVPKIQQFFQDKDLKKYIEQEIQQEFSQQVKENFSCLYSYALRYIQRRIELGCKTIPAIDKDLEIAKGEDKNLQLHLTSTFEALDILDHISQSAEKTNVIDNYYKRLSEFFTESSRKIIDIINKWKYEIDANNAQQILILVDDIVANDKLFSDRKFLKTFEINYQEEDNKNHGLVLTIRDIFRGEEPKKIFHKWGDLRVKELTSIDFVSKINQKSSKHERSIYYGQYIKIYQDLKAVTEKAQSQTFFELNKVPFCYSQTALEDMEGKVQKLKGTYVQEVYHHIVNGQVRNLLSQKQSRELNTFFQNIMSGYQNLQSILEFFNVIDSEMLKDINQILENFPNQVLQRVNKMAENARICSEKPPVTATYIDIEDLTRIGEIIIEIQLMKSNFIHMKKEIQQLQDEIIDEYDLIQEQKQNRGRIDKLMRLIMGQDWGAQILNECSAFEGHKIKELARKLRTKTLKQVLEQITGEDIIVEKNNLQLNDNFQVQIGSEITGKALLLEKYEVFQRDYQKWLKELTTVRTNDKGEILDINHSILVKEIERIKMTMNKHQWDNQNIEKLPKLLSLIFALWSLLKPEQLKKQQQSHLRQKKDIEEDKQQAGEFLDYLNQPHPAQVIGLMRILGIGYSPEEQPGFIQKIFKGSPQLKMRNNLVQIKTGEGKSVTLAVLSIILALCDFDVRCACYSAYLSDRDFIAFEPMFKILGLQDYIIYSTFNQICENEINKSGDLRQIIQSLVLKKENMIEIKSVQKARPQILLIDEVDVFFSDSFFGNTYMPQAQIQGEEVDALTDYIWANRKNDLTINKVSETQEYKNVQRLFKDTYAFIPREAVKQMIVDLLYVEKFNLGVKVEGLENIMDIIDGQVKYKVGDSWSSKVRDSYRTMFANYYYHDYPQAGKDQIDQETIKKYKAIGINFTQLSYAEIPIKFAMILGVTGTLDTLSIEQQKIMKIVYKFTSKTYAPSVYDIPGPKKDEDKIKGLKEEFLIMNESQMSYFKYHAAEILKNDIEVVNEMAIKIINGKDQWFKELAQRIGELIVSKNTEQSQQENQRAVIVFFKSEEIINEFIESIHFKQFASLKIGKLIDKLDNAERDSLVTNATIQGQITLSTREFGRGTDFKYHGNAVIEAGGLAVIQSFFTSDYSEEIQIRGRTRRQGTTGSYEIIVCQQDLTDDFGNKDNFIDSLLQLDPQEAYKKLHDKSIEEYEAKQRKKFSIREELRLQHEANIKYLDNIKLTVNRKQSVKEAETNKFIAMLKNLNKCHQYQMKERCIKTLVLIDATGSMTNVLKNVQQTILQYFEEVCKNLKSSRYNENLFKIQIAFYRNYSSGEDILSVSDWAGPDQKQELKEFVDNQSTSGGEGYEAMEVGFWHANKEIHTPSGGGEPVSLIFVIGDARANTKEQILSLKYQCPTPVDSSMTDEEAYNQYGYQREWNDNLQAKYGPSETWNEQLDKIKRFEDEDGFKVQVQSFYVDDNNKIDTKLDDFYSKLRVNNTMKDNGRLLNLKNPKSLVESLSVYTMKMIADKNPDGGDKEKLLQIAADMHIRQQLSHA